MDNTKLTFMDLSKNGSYTIPENRISLNYTQTTKTLSLNKTISDKIRSGEYNYLRVGYTGYSAEVYFIFCKKQTSDSLAVNTKARRINISSKYIVDKLVDVLSLQEKSQHLCISGNCSNSSDYLTFKITKQ